MTPMTHERCSELLAAYVQDEIAPTDRAEVSAHLGDCDACRHEEAGLRILLATESGSLDERERAHLRSGVMSAIAASDEAQVTSVYELQRSSKPAGSKRNWRAAVAGGLAAAAVVIIAAVFYTGGGFSGADGGLETAGEDGEGDTVQPAGRGSDRDEDNKTRANKAPPANAAVEQLQGGSDTTGAGAGTTTEATADGFVAPVPSFIAAERRYTNSRLKHAGQRGLQLVLFSRAYDTDDTVRLRDEFVDRLARSAARRAGDVAADQVRDCAAVVLAGEDTALPAVGAFGRRDGDDVLVLGFAWSDSGSGRLDHYMLWTWRRGSCDSPVDYRSGPIKPAN